MDRTLRELERAYCAGLVSRREFFRRAAFLLASTTAAFELLGRLSPRREAWASLPITLDLSTTDLAGQGYVHEGNPFSFAVDTPRRRLVIVDPSGDRSFFAKQVPEIPTMELDVSVCLNIRAGNLTLDGIDTGVHVVLNEGVLGGGREIRAGMRGPIG